MDFLPTEYGEVQFVYVLPLAPNRALIEFTVIGTSLWQEEHYAKGLSCYLSDRYEGVSYRIQHRELGRIPMSVLPGLHNKAKGALSYLGTPAGAVKASTGYAFLRIQESVEKLIASNDGPEKRSGFWLICDATLLRLMSTNFLMSDYLFGLFKHWGVSTVLDFLNEKTRWWETLATRTRS